MASITVDGIHKRYDTADALNSVSVSVRDGEFMTLVGPSGCGKSTLLRIIAGLEPQTSGDVLIDDVSVTGVRPSERNLAMVFQSYALYPHLSVFDNIAVPLRMRYHNRWQRMPILRWLIPGTRTNEHTIRERIVETAQSLGLGELLDRKPGQLSGGQRQRVAVGRAIVREPEAFLLDEPLSNLDAKMRVHMRTEITQLHRKLDATFVYVTHDQAEAMTMSDRIAVMMDGDIVQTGTPDEIYHQPVDRRVAEFIGSPKINMMPADNEEQDHGQVRVLDQPSLLRSRSQVRWLGVRPEACSVISDDSASASTVVLQGTVSHLENFGAEVFVHAIVQGMVEPLVVRATPGEIKRVEIDEAISVALDLKRALAFDSDGKSVECHLTELPENPNSASGPSVAMQQQ